MIVRFLQNFELPKNNILRLFHPLRRLGFRVDVFWIWFQSNKLVFAVNNNVWHSRFPPKRSAVMRSNITRLNLHFAPVYFPFSKSSKTLAVQIIPLWNEILHKVTPTKPDQDACTQTVLIRTGICAPRKRSQVKLVRFTKKKKKAT